MAEYISFQPSDYFNTLIYTGNNTADRALTGVGFQPDWVVMKNRDSAYNWETYDAPRGVEENINWNQNYTEATHTYGVKTFDSDGFTIGTVNDATNGNTIDYVNYNWKAGTTTGIAGSPSITPTSYSFNQTAGFSIITYTGTGASASLPHGLGVIPECIIVKQRVGNTSNWAVYHKHMRMPNGPAEDYGMNLNTTGADTTVNFWDDTAPTSTLFYVGSGAETNQVSGTYVAYCFAGKPGYSSFGRYIGNGNANGTFTYTGFRPAYLLTKTCNNSGQNWNLYDNKRPTYVNDTKYLEANTDAAEGTAAAMAVDFLSNGFKPRGNNSGTNGSAYNYVYMAFAEFPLVSSNDVPGVAR